MANPTRRDIELFRITILSKTYDDIIQSYYDQGKFVANKNGNWNPLPWGTGLFYGDHPSGQYPSSVFDYPAHSIGMWRVRWALYEQLRTKKYLIPVVLPGVMLKSGQETGDVPTNLLTSMMDSKHIWAQEIFFVCVQGSFEITLPDLVSNEVVADNVLTPQMFHSLVKPYSPEERKAELDSTGSAICWHLMHKCEWDYHNLKATSETPALGFYVAFQHPSAVMTDFERIQRELMEQFKRMDRGCDRMAAEYALVHQPTLIERHTDYCSPGSRSDTFDRNVRRNNKSGKRGWWCFFLNVDKWPQHRTTGGKTPAMYRKPPPFVYEEDPSSSSSSSSSFDYPPAPEFVLREPTPRDEILREQARINRSSPPPPPPPSLEAAVSLHQPNEAYIEGLSLIDEILEGMEKMIKAIYEEKNDDGFTQDDWFEEVPRFEKHCRQLTKALNETRATYTVTEQETRLTLLDEKAAQGETLRVRFFNGWETIRMPMITALVTSMDTFDQSWNFIADAPVPPPPADEGKKKRSREELSSPSSSRSKRQKRTEYTDSFAPFPPLNYLNSDI
jgi:hypothetical protein